jgi:hypothetical protein
MSESSPHSTLAQALRDAWFALEMSKRGQVLNHDHPAVALGVALDIIQEETRSLEEQLQTTQNILVEERRWREEAQKDALYMKEQLEALRESRVTPTPDCKCGTCNALRRAVASSPARES